MENRTENLEKTIQELEHKLCQTVRIAKAYSERYAPCSHCDYYGRVEDECYSCKKLEDFYNSRMILNTEEGAW